MLVFAVVVTGCYAATLTSDNGGTANVSILVEPSGGLAQLADLAPGQRWVADLGGSGAVVSVLNRATNTAAPGQDWSCYVTDQAVTLSSVEVAKASLWPWFAGGFSLGLAFYVFGWQMSIVNRIGSTRDA